MAVDLLFTSGIGEDCPLCDWISQTCGHPGRSRASTHRLGKPVRCAGLIRWLTGLSFGCMIVLCRLLIDPVCKLRGYSLVALVVCQWPFCAGCLRALEKSGHKVLLILLIWVWHSLFWTIIGLSLPACNHYIALGGLRKYACSRSICICSK